MAALRKALGDRTGKRYIANLSGRGYAFVAPVTRENALSATTAPEGMTVAGNLPALLTRVIGRDEITAALSARLARPQGQLQIAGDAAEHRAEQLQRFCA